MNDIPDLSLSVVNRENNPAYHFLNEESIVLIDGYEFRIKLVQEMPSYKNLQLVHILLDLVDMPFNQLLDGAYTPQNLLNQIINGTGFTLDLNTTGLPNVNVKEFGHTNKWRMLKDATELLQAEFTVLPGRVIRVRKQLSNDYGKQYRYAHNLRNISKKTDSSDVVTHVIVNYGEDLIHTATFTSPTASNYSRQHFGDIINDERIETYTDAQKRAEREFKDIDISYELDVMKHFRDVELGETIHTIYEPLNDLSIVTRILKTTEIWNGEQFVMEDATVGNYVFKTADEIIQDQIEKDKKETSEKIDEKTKIINNKMTLQFHETDQKIIDQHTTITSEYTAAISLSAQELRTDMSAKVTTINSDMQIIRNDVSSISQTASAIQSTVSSQQTQIGSLGTRMTSAESQITQTANQISQKVSYTDYNGDTIASLINQTATSIRIQASKIQLVGAVSVLSDITGALGNITSGNIDIQQDVLVGSGIYMRGYGPRNGIYFGGAWGSQIYDDRSGNMTVEAGTHLNLSGTQVNVWGDVNFYGNVSGVAGSGTSGLSIAYSAASKRLYVRLYGSDVGYVSLT